MTVKIDNPNINIKGCNRLWSTFIYDAVTKEIKFEQFAATRMACSIDQDSLITNALQSSRKVFKQGSSIVFVNLRGE
jgi:heat shock protein HslJ